MTATKNNSQVPLPQGHRDSWISICAAISSAILSYMEILIYGFNVAQFASWILLLISAIACSRMIAKRLTNTESLSHKCITLLLITFSVCSLSVTWLGFFRMLSVKTLGLELAVLGIAISRVHPPHQGDSTTKVLSGHLSSAALCGIAISAASWMFETKNALLYYPTDSDNMWYHFPMIAEWSRSGSIWDAGAIPLIARGYPGFHEAILAFLTLPLRDEHMAILSFIEVFWIGLIIFVLCRDLKASPSIAALGACYVVTAPQVALGGHGNDLAFAIFFLMSLQALQSRLNEDSAQAAILAGLSTGAMAATKFSGLFYAAGLFALYLMSRIALLVRKDASASTLRSSLARDTLMLALFVSIVLPWLARNISLYRNPIYPAELRVLSRVFLPGPLERDFFQARTLGTDFYPLAKNWHHFIEAFGVLIFPMVIAAMISSWILVRRLGLSRAILPIGTSILAFVLFLFQPFNKPSHEYFYNMRYLIPWFGSLVVVALPTFVALGDRFSKHVTPAILLIGCIANVAEAIPRYGWGIAVVIAAGLILIRRRPSLLGWPQTLFRAFVSIALILGLASISLLRDSLRDSSSYGIRDMPSSRGWGKISRYVHKNIEGKRIAVIGDERFFYLYGKNFANSLLFIPLNKGPMLGELGSESETLRPLFDFKPQYLVFFNPIRSRPTAGGYTFDEQAAEHFLRERGLRVKIECDEAGSLVGKFIDSDPVFVPPKSPH
jgi:hypothetical protein